MRQQLLALGRQSIVYGLSTAAVQAVGLVTLPIFTRAFTPAEYGVIELATVAFAALLVIIDAGLGSAMQRAYFAVPEADATRRRDVVSTAVLSSTLFAAGVAVLMLLAREPLSVALFGDERHADVVVLLALAVPLAALATFLRDVMRLRFQPGRFAISAGLAGVVTAVVGVTGVVAFDGDEAAVVAGFPAGQAAAALYGLVVLRGSVGRAISRAELRAMLRWGLPLVPATAAMWGLSFLDRLVLAKLDGLAATGQYAVTSRFGSVLMFVVGALATAYTPFLFAQHAEDADAERALRARTLGYASAAFVALALVLGYFAREIATLVAPGFDDAYTAVGTLCIGIAALGLVPMLAAGIQLAGRTWWIARYTGIMVAANLVLCVVLIPLLGFVGAAIATAVGYLGLAGLLLHRSQQLDRAPFPTRMVLLLFLLGAALTPIGLVDTGRPLVDAAAKLGGLAVFGAATVRLRVIGPRELEALRWFAGDLRGRIAPSVG